MIQSAPSRTALATSEASARVGLGFLIMLSSICVAQITGLPARLHRPIIIFWARNTCNTPVMLMHTTQIQSDLGWILALKRPENKFTILCWIARGFLNYVTNVIYRFKLQAITNTMTSHCSKFYETVIHILLSLTGRDRMINMHNVLQLTSLNYLNVCSVLYRPWSEGWPHHGRTFSILDWIRLQAI